MARKLRISKMLRYGKRYPYEFRTNSRTTFACLFYDAKIDRLIPTTDEMVKDIAAVEEHICNRINKWTR